MIIWNSCPHLNQEVSLADMLGSSWDFHTGIAMTLGFLLQGQEPPCAETFLESWFHSRKPSLSQHAPSISAVWTVSFRWDCRLWAWEPRRFLKGFQLWTWESSECETWRPPGSRAYPILLFDSISISGHL